MSNSDVLNALHRLDSDLLRTFLQVATTGSFSKAAPRIFRSQSAVSMQMKQLEQLLGQPLFERHGRGIRLTPTAERLRPVAMQVVNLLDQTAAELQASGLRGSLRLGIPDEYADSLLPGLIARFARENPAVELIVRCSFSAGFARALAEGELDVAVHAPSKMIAGATLLRREKTFWVASRHHQVHEQEPLPIALFDRDCWWRNSALDALEAAGRDFREVVSSESANGIAAAVAAGVAVALMGEDSLRPDFMRLTPKQGFPPMAESALVLQVREGADSALSRALCEMIEASFEAGAAPA